MKIKIVILFIILSSLFTTNGCSRNTSCDLVEIGLEGVLIEKNYSPKNRRARGIVIRFEGRDEGFALGDVDEEFYNILEVGDTLYKRHHSREVTILRGNREFQAELQCGLQ